MIRGGYLALYRIPSKEVYRQAIIKALKVKPMTYGELVDILSKSGACNTSLYWYLNQLKANDAIKTEVRHNGGVGRPMMLYMAGT